MARLIYSAICSLDGYIADEDGNFGWGAPDEAVHAFVNEQERSVGTYLYGRRLYEVMVAWETMPGLEREPAVIRDYAAIWRAADKVVYSRSLPEPLSARTRIERAFDPDAIRQLKASAGQDLSIGGAELAGQALRAGLVDELRLLVAPVLVGGGTRALPGGLRLTLDLRDERRFASGFVHLGYTVRP